ncbi:flagellar biosynthesis protein FlhA [Limnobacter humi]|uniref:Flagellar biosynthesis protein FlhA n=1 Tax=Limnobacter humi TaxID=1778671 RepID=A0ABT1WDF7_9BURK|nr:flagellar biosynthesis protein FlhA [Limnobacter humi]MCQ8895555.1 flagellar biosynthesis protein FlhA [Limnobacter humi]
MLKLFEHLGSIASKRSDIFAAVMLFFIVAMMIIPIDSRILDVLIALNITISVLLVISSILLSSPLSFSSFPAILLISTLFRLSLTISTTRLILLDGFAGHIIEAFGEFVVGGNVAVGLILFTIISIVNFIVITKGSERVAEVAARFCLDGMPGKQLSIDSDLRAGLIDQATAKKRRSVLERETQLYGAMDGAIKFVKGDAIAGLIIALVNLIGGLAIGMAQHDMTFSEAGHRYAILTVGDGLMGQISALLISISSGFIVTRVTKEAGNDSSIARDLLNELGGNPKALLISACVAILFAAVPGMPSIAFMCMAVGLAAIWYLRGGKDQLIKVEKDPFANLKPQFDAPSMAVLEDIMTTELAQPLCVVLPADQTEEFCSGIQYAARYARNQLISELGAVIPPIQFRKSKEQKHLSIEIFGVPFIELKEEMNQLWVCCSEAILNKEKIPFKAVNEAISGVPLLAVDYQFREQLIQIGLAPEGVQERLIVMLQSLVLKKIKDLYSLAEYSSHSTQLASVLAEQFKELERLMPNLKVLEIIQRLLQERVSIKNFKTILTGLIEWAQKERDPVQIAEQIRWILRDQISHSMSDHGIVRGYLLDTEFEETIRMAIRQTATGVILDFDTTGAESMIKAISPVIDAKRRGEQGSVIVCSADCRRHLRRLLEDNMFWLPVLSFNEISSFIRFETLGEITLEYAEEQEAA